MNIKQNIPYTVQTILNLRLIQRPNELNFPSIPETIGTNLSAIVLTLSSLPLTSISPQRLQATYNRYFSTIIQTSFLFFKRASQKKLQHGNKTTL